MLTFLSLKGCSFESWALFAILVKRDSLGGGAWVGKGHGQLLLGTWDCYACDKEVCKCEGSQQHKITGGDVLMIPQKLRLSA